MNEEQKNNIVESESLAETVIEAEPTVEANMSDKFRVDYMSGVNRILTSLLAGLIGSGLLLFGIYFGAQLLGQSFGADGQFSIQFLLLATLVLFLSLLITQIIQMYLYKLVEKETYAGIGPKVYKNFIAQLVLLVLVFPFIFVFLTFSQFAVGILFGVYLIFSLALAISLRESQSGPRLIGSMLGLFLAAVLSIVFFYSLDTVQVLLAVMVLPIGLICSSLFELLADIAVGVVS